MRRPRLIAARRRAGRRSPCRPRPACGASLRRRVRRVAAGRDREHLGGHSSPGEHEDEGEGRHVSERRELGKVPGRVEAEPEAQGHRAEDEQWSREAGDVQQRARSRASRPRACTSQSHAWAEGRTNSSAWGFVPISTRAMTASAASATAMPATSSSESTGPSGTRRPRETSQPAATTRAKSASASRGQWVAASDAGLIAASSPQGHAPMTAKSMNTAPAKSQKPSLRR